MKRSSRISPGARESRIRSDSSKLSRSPPIRTETEGIGSGELLTSTRLQPSRSPRRALGASVRITAWKRRPAVTCQISADSGGSSVAQNSR